MGRPAGSNGPRTAAAIRRVGLQLIYRHGYEAMTLRELASEVGIQPASLYNHIRTKQSLLFDLIREHLAMLLTQTDEALAAAAPSATAQLRKFIEHHIIYHLEKKQEVFIANFELRALTPENFAVVVKMRRDYENKLINILSAGSVTAELNSRDDRVVAYAILAMLTGASTWYKSEGRLTQQEIVAYHTDLILRGCANQV